MREEINADICVIGAGAGGLSVAAGASQLGQKVVLVEKHKMGGDCLNYGCVPSKALIAAARAAAAMRDAGRLGVDGQPSVDYARVRAHIRGVIAAIAPNNSVERFTGLGVRVIRAAARFTGPDEVTAGEAVIHARRYVVATGSSPGVPPIPGLDTVPHLTNETVFDLEACPEHLIVIGGGPIGCELAQAQRRLGARVTVLEQAAMMPKDDPELVDFVRRRMSAEGCTILEDVKVKRIGGAAGAIAVTIEQGGAEREIAGSHLLIAAGRRANVQDLGLQAAGVRYSPKGIEVDRRLRSSNRRIYAVGDAAGGYQFTHVAGHHAGIFIRNALFRLPVNAHAAPVPWVTYTEPELAHVGLTEAEARKRHGDRLTILRWPFHDNDRAQTGRETGGLIKVVASARGRLLGTSIVGPNAGELILPWVLAHANGIKLRDMASAIAPYPTLSEVSKRVAGSYFTPQLFSARSRWLVRLLAKLG